MKLSIVLFFCLLSAGIYCQGSYNTLVGKNAGRYLTGSFNFIIGEDSTAVNSTGDYLWYIQPDAKFFNQCPDCLKCLLLIYPHVYAFLPEDRALIIIEKARKCLP